MAKVSKVVLLAPLLFAASCGATLPTAGEAQTEKEIFASSEVSRFSAKLHKNLPTYFSEKGLHIPAGTGGCPADAPDGCKAAAWYQAGVIFWKEWVARESTSFEDLTAVAAHEVCHSLSYFHDQLHANCMRNLGVQPTYSVD